MSFLSSLLDASSQVGVVIPRVKIKPKKCKRTVDLTQRDLAFLKYVRIGQTEEGYPSNLPRDCDLLTYPTFSISSPKDCKNPENAVVLFTENILLCVCCNDVVWDDNRRGSVFCSHYDLFVHLCRTMNMHNLSKYKTIQLVNRAQNWYCELTLSHTHDAERFYLKFWMDVCGSYQSAFDKRGS